MSKKATRKKSSTTVDPKKKTVTTEKKVVGNNVTKKKVAKKKVAKKKVTKTKVAGRTSNKAKSSTSKLTSHGSRGSVSPAEVLPNFGVPMAQIREYYKENFFAVEESKRRAQEALDRNSETLKANPHVTGMHVGLRRRNGEVVWPPQYCIRVHVRDKYKPDGHPRITHSIDKTLDGVVVDVFQQNYESFASPANTLPSLAPPVLVGGLPIANADVPSNWGTLGLPLFQNSQRVFLTNQHVVGSGPQTNVIQPPADSSSASVIGNVVASRLDNIIDAAVVESNGSRAAINQIHGLDGQILFGVLFGEDQNGGVAFKIGAASGTNIVLGRIKSANARVLVDDSRWMDNQIIVDPPLGQSIITGGDSGSILLQQVPHPFGGSDTTYEMIGLVHGGTKQGSLVACHIYKVFRAFKLSLFPQ